MTSRLSYVYTTNDKKKNKKTTIQPKKKKYKKTLKKIKIHVIAQQNAGSKKQHEKLFDIALTSSQNNKNKKNAYKPSSQLFSQLPSSYFVIELPSHH